MDEINEKILSAYEKNVLGIKKTSNINEDRKMMQKQVADNFVRFLIGDRKQALNNLKNIGYSDESKKFMKQMADDSQAYNKLFGQLFKDMEKITKFYV